MQSARATLSASAWAMKCGEERRQGHLPRRRRVTDGVLSGGENASHVPWVVLQQPLADVAGEGVGDAVGGGMGDAGSNGVGDAVGDGAGEAVGDGVDGEVGDGDAVGDGMGEAVGDGVGDAVGNSVDDAVHYDAAIRAAAVLPATAILLAYLPAGVALPCAVPRRAYLIPSIPSRPALFDCELPMGGGGSSLAETVPGENVPGRIVPGRNRAWENRPWQNRSWPKPSLAENAPGGPPPPRNFGARRVVPGAEPVNFGVLGASSEQQNACARC